MTYVYPGYFSTDGKDVPFLFTSSGGPTVTVGNPSTVATNPWSSAPGFNLPIVSASSGLMQVSGPITLTTEATGGLTGSYRLMTTVSGFSTRASKLFAVMVASTVVGPVFCQVYDATSSGVTAGTTTPKLVIPCKLTSAAITVDPHYPSWFPIPPHGIAFSAGISAAITSLSSNGTMVQGYLNLVHTT